MIMKKNPSYNYKHELIKYLEFDLQTIRGEFSSSPTFELASSKTYEGGS